MQCFFCAFSSARLLAVGLGSGISGVSSTASGKKTRRKREEREKKEGGLVILLVDDLTILHEVHFSLLLFHWLYENAP